MTEREKMLELADRLGEISGRCSLELDRETIIKAANALRSFDRSAELIRKIRAYGIRLLDEAEHSKEVGAKDAQFAAVAGAAVVEAIIQIVSKHSTVTRPDAAPAFDTTAVIDALTPFAGLADVWCTRFGINGEFTTSIDLADLNRARRVLTALTRPQGKPVDNADGGAS